MKDYMTDVNAILKQYIGKGLIPCAQAAVVTTEGVYSTSQGFSSLLPKREVLREDAVFDLASLTKVVATTTLALQCLEKGLLNLDMPIQYLLLDFPYSEVTVGHVMTHTSGICHDDKAYKQLNSKEELREFFFQKPLEFKPGSQVVYSDFGYIALGFMIEAVLGPLDTVFQRDIAKPLDMRDTGYCPASRGLSERCVPTEITKERGRIQGEVHDGKAHILHGVSGNAGLFSTMEDLTHFVTMMLQGGVFKGEKVLSQASVNQLKKCKTEGLNQRRTLGWWTDEPAMSFGDYYSSICIYHTGFTGTSIYIDFLRGCGIILLTNRIHPTRENPYITDFRNMVHNAILSQWELEK